MLNNKNGHSDIKKKTFIEYQQCFYQTSQLKLNRYKHTNNLYRSPQFIQQLVYHKQIITVLKMFSPPNTFLNVQKISVKFSYQRIPHNQNFSLCQIYVKHYFFSICIKTYLRVLNLRIRNSALLIKQQTMRYKYLCPFFRMTYVHPLCGINPCPNSSCPS